MQCTCTWMYYNVLFTSIVFSMDSPTVVSIQYDKVIVSMPQLLQLVPSTCLHPSCASKLSHSTQFRGCGVYLHFRCDQGHTYSWSSSYEHLDKRGYSVHSIYCLVLLVCSQEIVSVRSHRCWNSWVSKLSQKICIIGDCTGYSVHAHHDFTSLQVSESLLFPTY